MAKFNDSDIQGSYSNAQPNFDENSRANTGSYNGGGGSISGEGTECDSEDPVVGPLKIEFEGDMYASTRATPAYQYTTGQLEYAKTCVKKTLNVQGYDIDNEFEEKHTITVEEVSFSESTSAFNATRHSDAVFGAEKRLCGQGLRFRLEMRGGKGVFESLWDLPDGTNQFDYFDGKGLMKLVCQHEIPTLPQLADHGCIAGYLINFDYWYKISRNIEVGDKTYFAGTYIKVMPNGEFEGNFEFENEEDVPIKSCDGSLEVKDVVELDVNGVWVKERPKEGPLSNAGVGIESPGGPAEEDEQCVIKHVGENGYTITARTDQEPVTHSYDYGTVIDPVTPANVRTAIFGGTRGVTEGRAIFFPPDDLAFIPVWDELCFIEGEVIKSVSGPEGPSCPTNDSDPNRKETVLESDSPDINADKIWNIEFFQGYICTTNLDQLSANPGEQENCGFFTASMLNHLSDGENPEYFRTKFGEVKTGTYQADVTAGTDPKVEKEVDGEKVEKVKVDVFIDCWDASIGGPYNQAEINTSPENINCLHCDCHTVVGSSTVKVNIPCDPCDRCGNGDGTIEEPADYVHFQNTCPDLFPEGPLEIGSSCGGGSGGSGGGCISEDLTMRNHFLLDEEETISVDLGYSYRSNTDNTTWDYGYGLEDNNSVEYGEKETFRCIISYNGGCISGMDFMKKTPEFSGNSKLTLTYRKIVSADEFSECENRGAGRRPLPDLNYSHFDLLNVEGSVVGGGFDGLDFFPQAALATKVGLKALKGDLESFGLNAAEQLKINTLLAKFYDPNAVIHKTQVESQKGLCGMGAKFRNRREKNTEPIDYSVHCRWDQYKPSLYADVYGTVNKDDYKSLLAEYDELIKSFGLSIADGQKIFISHFHGERSFCKERMDRADRVPEIHGKKIDNGYDNFKYFGCRFVNPAVQGDNDPDDPADNCDGTGEATFVLDTCEDAQAIEWRLEGNHSCPHEACIPDPPANASTSEFEQCRKYIERPGSVDGPPKKTVKCKDANTDCGIATFELKNLGGEFCAPTAHWYLYDLKNLDSERPTPDWKTYNGFPRSQCEAGCVGVRPVDVTFFEIEVWRLWKAEDDKRKAGKEYDRRIKRPRRGVLENNVHGPQPCVKIGNGEVEDWQWVLVEECNIEQCTAAFPAEPNERQIEQAREGRKVRQDVACLRNHKDQDLGPSCVIKCEDKPTPRPYVTPEGRKCSEDMMTEYANKVIGYTEKDAQRYNVLFENLIKPISPAEVESALNKFNRPEYQVTAHKELCSLEKYRFTIGDTFV